MLLVGVVATGVNAQTPQTYRDIPYDAIPGIPVEQLCLDVYTRNDFAGRPVLLYIHGGSWESGDKSVVGVKGDDALARGYVFVSLNYRLATENVVFSVHIQDVARAIGWVYRNISNYGGDPQRLYLMGHSAGCHLAALVSSDPRWLAAHGLSPAVLRATIPLDTRAYDLVALAGSDGSLGPTYTDIFGFDPKFWSFASPQVYVTAGRALPPMCVAYSSGTSGTQASARRADATGFVGALTDAAIPSRLIDGSSKTHAQINEEFGLSGDFVTDAAYDFIEHVSDFSRLQFRRDYPVGTCDTNGQFIGGTEMEALTAHDGMLFAGNGYWKDAPGDDPALGAQVLVKPAATAPWRQDIHFGLDYLSVESLASVTLTTDADGTALPQPVPLLLAGPQHIVAPFCVGVWSRQDATGAWTQMPLAINQTNRNGVSRAQVRALAEHVDRVTGVHRVFAGTGRGAVYSGVYDAVAPGRIRWDVTPELPEVPVDAQERVYAFAEANGVLYASVASNDNPLDTVGGLFRRVDGATPTWEFVYEWPVVAGKGEGLRGLTAVPAAPGSTDQVLIGGLEGPGQIIRIDPGHGHAVTVEFDYRSFFTNLWGALGGAATISAYNDMTPVTDSRDGKPLHLIGLWVNHPQDTTPPHNGSYYLVRHPDARYEWARVFDETQPVPAGNELKATRCIVGSPFPTEGGRVFYFCGYDAGGANTRHNTAWIYRAELPAIELMPLTGYRPEVQIEPIGESTWTVTLMTRATGFHQLEDSANLTQWVDHTSRITGTGWPYLTVWTPPTNATQHFLRSRTTIP
jgi:acetyl esterase/lipase